ncbi:MAG TPA: universal stress protein [Rhodocyclaceae bacterium]
MFETILVAYDGSEAAGHAFDRAIDLADKYNAMLRVVAVARVPDFGSEVETEAVLENSRKHYLQVLKPLKDRVAGRYPAVEFEVAVGHPAEHIIIEAERWGADLIVMGHRGQGVLGRWLVGSVAKQVMQHAPCAVLIAR